MDNGSFIECNTTCNEPTSASSTEDPFERGKTTLWDLDNDYFDRDLDFFATSHAQRHIEPYNDLIPTNTDAEQSVWPRLEDTDIAVPITITPNFLQSIPFSTPVLEQPAAINESAQVNSTSSEESVTVGSDEDASLQLKIKDIQRRFTTHNSNKTTPTPTPFKKELQKPPTTAGITLDDLKAVFHLERPKAEKRLRLKRTTFSNLSRYYGISKWPFRTIRDAMNRMNANEKMLQGKVLSKDKCRKLREQQRLLSGVIDLIYSDPKESKDTNTLAVLLRIVAARENPGEFPEM